MEIDNLVYATGINEQWRRRMDEVGHVVLDEDAAASISRMKTVHTVVISAAVPGALFAFYLTESSAAYTMPLMGAMLLAAILETAVASGPKAKRIGEAAVSTILGMMAFVFLQGVI